MPSTDEWPAHSSELSRKAMETLERAIHDHTVEGTLDEEGLLLVVNTIHETVMGLVPDEVSDTIYAVRKGIENANAHA